jgi:amino acid transporter
MIVPTYLIVPPAMAAMALYMLLYYVWNPENRITDRRFLLGLACVAVVVGQMVMLILRIQQAIPSAILVLAAWGLLVFAIWSWQRRRPASTFFRRR